MIFYQKVINVVTVSIFYTFWKKTAHNCSKFIRSTLKVYLILNLHVLFNFYAKLARFETHRIHIKEHQYRCHHSNNTCYIIATITTFTINIKRLPQQYCSCYLTIVTFTIATSLQLLKIYVLYLMISLIFIQCGCSSCF